MPTDFHKLSRLITARDVNASEAEIIARAWEERHLRMGEMLWTQGSSAPELGLLVSGRLSVQVEGEEIGFILPGDLVGETSALWAGAIRSASLQATEPCSVLLLSSHELQRLAQFPTFHHQLLDRCLEVQGKRIRATDLRIAKLSQGVIPAPVTSADTGLARLWKFIKAVASDHTRPALLPLLRDQPGLQDKSEHLLDELAGAFVPHAFDDGELLTREGEPGDAVFLLAVGEVQALRHVRKRMAELLVTFQPGWLFGAVTLAVPGPRTATCRATGQGWVYRMDRAAFETLGCKAQRAWKECLVATLGVQLRNANALLAGFQSGDRSGGPLTDHQLVQLLRAAGALTGTGAPP
jgi:CRP-like cAMP-binding protein